MNGKETREIKGRIEELRGSNLERKNGIEVGMRERKVKKMTMKFSTASVTHVPYLYI